MSKIFITGSSDGLGLLSAQALAKRGHAVTLHARNESRAADVLVADLASLEETKRLAAQLNERGPWDAVVHNAGIMTRRPGGGGGGGGGDKKNELFAVNTLAPYVLTCLVRPPAGRYVFLSSSMHVGGDASLRDVEGAGYSDTKLHNVMLAKWFARRLEGVDCSSMDPGWVPTKMGGAGATDDIGKSVATYVLLAEGAAAEVKEAGAGSYWRDSRVKAPIAAAGDEAMQDRLVEMLKGISGVLPPE
ncbi:hypothetical protein PG993_011825 [Apiospora rasikravindrae]|uniref:Short-chain dehydrogenase n=1 Tax=Apiospora rasikravindrae TaxID=990691 RepID=A0ABR1S0Q0_9PEZI